MYSSRIKRLREENKVLEKDMAKILGIEESHYSHCENETKLFIIKHLNNISNYFEVSIDYILGLSDIKSYPNSNKKIDNKVVGKRLKEIREKDLKVIKEIDDTKKIIQEILAEDLQTNKSVISGYETGRYPIATLILYKLCKKYHVSADYILGKIDKPKYLK